MTSWYYANPKTRERFGPFDESFVRTSILTGDIQPDYLVWHEGLPDWTPAGRLFPPSSITGSETLRIPLPDGLTGWMCFVGCMTLLAGVGALWFLPAGIALLMAAAAIFAARGALLNLPAGIPPEQFHFFSKLRSIFACFGWVYIMGLFLLVLLVLLSTALTLGVIPSDFRVVW